MRMDVNAGFGGWVRPALWSGAAMLIAAPLVAMQFTDEVSWTAFDFAFAIVLVGSVGVGLELAMRLGPNWLYRAGAALALATGFLMTWINAAVSIVGGDASAAKPLFLGVIAVALAGAALARFRPAGMARAMMAAAAAQVAAPLIAQFARLGVSGGQDMLKVAVLTAGFCALWMGSAWLFRRAGQASSPSDR